MIDDFKIILYGMVDKYLNSRHVAILLPRATTPKSARKKEFPISNFSLFNQVRPGNFSSEGAKQSFITFVVHSVISSFLDSCCVTGFIGHLIISGTFGDLEQ